MRRADALKLLDPALARFAGMLKMAGARVPEAANDARDALRLLAAAESATMSMLPPADHKAAALRQLGLALQQYERL